MASSYHPDSMMALFSALSALDHEAIRRLVAEDPDLLRRVANTPGGGAASRLLFSPDAYWGKDHAKNRAAKLECLITLLECGTPFYTRESAGDPLSRHLVRYRHLDMLAAILDRKAVSPHPPRFLPGLLHEAFTTTNWQAGGGSLTFPIQEMTRLLLSHGVPVTAPHEKASSVFDMGLTAEAFSHSSGPPVPPGFDQALALVATASPDPSPRQVVQTAARRLPQTLLAVLAHPGAPPKDALAPEWEELGKRFPPARYAAAQAAYLEATMGLPPSRAGNRPRM